LANTLSYLKPSSKFLFIGNHSIVSLRPVEPWTSANVWLTLIPVDRPSNSLFYIDVITTTVNCHQTQWVAACDTRINSTCHRMSQNTQKYVTLNAHIETCMKYSAITRLQTWAITHDTIYVHKTFALSRQEGSNQVSYDSCEHKSPKIKKQIIHTTQQSVSQADKRKDYTGLRTVTSSHLALSMHSIHYSSTQDRRWHKQKCWKEIN